MTVNEKKPLYVQLNSELKPNVLPAAASAVGYDMSTGNYIYYNTGSDNWENSPEMKPIYWQSDSSGHIYTTGSVFAYQDITGSNLVLDDPASRILAPNGALVISSSAGTFITGSLIVSGTRSDLGTENTSVLFNGDIFVSGGIGLNDYIQLKPVGTLRIPTNTTSSYIYTSGSTNDIYFTQYNGPYTNTTRLRWLESVLNTGLLHGGVLSTTNGSTTFNITSGSGLILSYNASTTTDPYPTVQFLQWPAYTNQSLTYVTSSQITYIGVNNSGGIIQRTTPFDEIDYESYIVIGRVLHQSGSVTNGTITSPATAYANVGSHDTFVRAFGPLKLSGHVLAASGSTLGLTKTGGDSYVLGRNYTANPSSPDLVLSTTDFALTGSKIYREYVSGSTPVIDTGVGTAGYTEINPGQYNNNGTLASVASGQYSIQRVYWFPNSVNRALFVYYGTETYNSIDVAQASIADETFIEGANTAGAAIFVGYIIVKGNATDLSDPAQAKIIQGPLFRAAGSGGGGGGGGTTTPGGLDTYVQFNDGGSTFGGVAGLTFNKTTNTLSTTNLTVSSIATVSGNVNLGDAASDVVYISGSVTASNGLQVIGSINGSSTIIATSDIVASGVLKSLMSAGDEGGEINLALAQTNNTLTGSVNIDVYQNRLRIFESGGTNRGGYFDISALSTGVGTNLAGSSPGGSSGQVQYNNAGNFGGATNVSIGGGDLVLAENTSPTTPSANTVKVFAQPIAGRELISGLSSVGRAYSYQPHMGRSKYGIWMLAGGSTGLTAEGIGAANATGTVTTRTPTLTGFASSLRRVGFVTATTANAPAGWRLGATWFWRGDNTNRGGFHYITRFVPSNATTTLSGRYFIGMNGTNTGTAATEPSNWVNIIGMGCNSGSANFSIMHNDASGAATTIDLGSNFSAVSSSVDVYELALYCPPSGSSVEWRVENFTKNAVTTGSITTNLPASTQGLNLLGYTETGGAVAVALDLISMYIETEF